jgi:hypothetical protein
MHTLQISIIITVYAYCVNTNLINTYGETVAQYSSRFV